MKIIQLIVAVSIMLISFQVAAGAATKTVEAVHKERAALAGKQVTVTGKVVKVNNGIMRRNFLHVQDGSGGKDTNNLVVTSGQTAKVGQKVTITGTVVLDTDFGMGYKYPLMVEKSSVTLVK
jgi:starvation-inducible outer membrane lipoprotein